MNFYFVWVWFLVVSLASESAGLGHPPTREKGAPALEDQKERDCSGSAARLDSRSPVLLGTVQSGIQSGNQCTLLRVDVVRLRFEHFDLCKRDTLMTLPCKRSAAGVARGVDIVLSGGAYHGYPDRPILAGSGDDGGDVLEAADLGPYRIGSGTACGACLVPAWVPILSIGGCQAEGSRVRRSD